MYKARVSAVGHYVPPKVVSNDDLSKLMDTSNEWIIERTGIQERRFADPETDTTSVMGSKAAKVALERAGMEASDLDFIIFATLSPDYYFPGPGVMVQEQLGIPEIGALDVRNQCSGFIYSLSVADQFIRSGMYQRILVIGSELHSGGLDFTTRGRNVSVIFGDGAGAAIVERASEDHSGILSTHLHSEGKHAKELALIEPSTSHWVDRLIEEGGSTEPAYHPYMNGNFVFKHAITRFQEVIYEALHHNGKEASDIDLLIPHQANLRISQFIQEKMKLRDDQVMNNIMRFGNTTAASIPIAWSEAWEEGRLKEGDLICLAAFGSGFTWASALLYW